MRTTVDLPPLLHRRLRELARERGQSMSTVVAQLAARGLDETAEPAEIRTDPRSGLPVVSVGRPITSEDVARMVEEE